MRSVHGPLAESSWAFTKGFPSALARVSARSPALWNLSASAGSAVFITPHLYKHLKRAKYCKFFQAVRVRGERAGILLFLTGKSEFHDGFPIFLSEKAISVAMGQV